ncbi:MAG: molybdenum cofactor guanylyltransferase [Candidatus Schekmanbacteria bacterium]|nr:molybdenum cofactor guanylyltransferase [Candidatus Schekmanbacteria bacterium]
MTALILAGGQSRRLKQDKAWLELGGKPLIRRVADCLAPLFDEILLVGAASIRYKELGLTIIPDEQPGEGPLGGLYTGLQVAQTPWVFCCACDMPFLNPTLITALLDQIEPEYTAVVCRWEQHLHPLHAFYSQSSLPQIKQTLDVDKRRLHDLLANLRVKYIDEGFIKLYDPQGLSFFNLNTPDALQKATEIFF